ncbi:CbiX/SirB N-terminal domain-containing protein [Cohaesibacter gelatinilyticus]|uniref:Sirohydrochlorin ferrochelatase n=1 Tax=Cohaesibacter gelatinilyticus TaxID=372072 RepID=A0A285NE17_9HYPH|nr:CbiX/SirB N-terminal domain-containing protein [Cohaesibacter gelatinilyticus]SNZ07197.1 Sirohydrochlorin ferrochelatase [Cohaesibacter gelatinilyticus]
MDHIPTDPVSNSGFHFTLGKGVLMVAHGERGGRLNNAALLDLVDQIRDRLDGVEIEAGVLKGEPSLSEGWDGLSAEDRYIYPFFMSDGFFVSRILPKKIREAVGFHGNELTMLAPFGISPQLGPALLNNLKRTLAGLGRQAEIPPLLIAAHGASVDKQSSLRANQLANYLSESGRFSEVHCAFLDEAPYLEDIVPDLNPQSLVLPLFNGLGSHSIDDMSALRIKSPNGVHYLPPVGGEEWVADIVAHDIEQALFGSGHQIACQDAAQ